MTLINPAITWVPTDETLGARLALVRQRFGWNMKEAALACGLPQSSWIEWETRNRVPRNITEVAQQIHERTGVDDYWLLTGKRRGDFPSEPMLCAPSDLNREPTDYGTRAPAPLRRPSNRKDSNGPRKRAA